MTKVSYVVNRKEFSSYAKAQEERKKTGKNIVTKYTYSDELERSKPDEDFKKKIQEYFRKRREEKNNEN